MDIKPIGIEELRKMDLSNSEISLKIDGTLMFFQDNHLISPRGITRDDRYSHILKILKENNFPDCFGELYAEIEKDGKIECNVFTISRSENFSKAKFMPIDMFDKTESYFKRQEILRNKIKEINSEFITPKILFSDIDSAYKYVLENKSEGLVIVKNGKMYKWKLLQEAKVKIKSHEAGKEKGCFILDDKENNRVSGTSMEFIKVFEFLKNKGEDVYAEVEYQFKTDEGKMFQPRLRRIGTKQEILGEGSDFNEKRDN